MRLSVVVGACALLVSAPSIASAQAAQKFAFINSQAVLQAAPGAVEAQVTLQKELETMRAQVTKLTDSLTAMDEAYKKEELTLSPTAKEARLKTLRDKQAEFQDRVQKLNDQAQQREGELMQPVMESIRKVLDDLRMEGGYSFIFDVAAGSFIVSADKNLDITDRVLAKLRLSAPKAAAKPPAGPAAAPAGIRLSRRRGRTSRLPRTDGRMGRGPSPLLPCGTDRWSPRRRSRCRGRVLRRSIGQNRRVESAREHALSGWFETSRAGVVIVATALAGHGDARRAHHCRQTG
jgi:outer membrane protein